MPNNFRLHRAYHDSYSNIRSKIPWAAGAEGLESRKKSRDFSKFYRLLADAPHPCRVIEYPAPYGDGAALFYFYQQIHHCEVIAGTHPMTAKGANSEGQPTRDACVFGS